MPSFLRETSADAPALATCPNCGTRLTVDWTGARWTIHGPRDIADRLMVRMGGLEREELHVLLLDTKNHVLDDVTVYMGNVSSSLVRVGELFTAAVRRGAPNIILAHNHPSGDATPSPDDIHLTSQAIAAGKLLDIDVLDHIVITAGAYISMRDRGMEFTR